MADDLPLGLRRRRVAHEILRRPVDTGPVARQEQLPVQGPSENTSTAVWRLSRLYCTLSAFVAVLAIVTAPTNTLSNTTRTSAFFETPNREREVTEKTDFKLETTIAIRDASASLYWLKHNIGWLGAVPEKAKKVVKIEDRRPPWLRWLPSQPPKHDPEETLTIPQSRLRGLVSQVVIFLRSCLDPGLFEPNSQTFTGLIDKVITSTPRLVAIANLLISLTFLLHTAVADWFLGTGIRHSHDWAASAGRERLGGFLIFKLLLISAVVAPDTLDLLILLSWYTLLSFLRSLAQLCAGTTRHTIQSGQPPRPGVLKLLVAVLFSDFFAAAVCVALFHAAGWGMVLLLTCDCALLAVDVICHILMHAGQVLEAQHSERVNILEAQQLSYHQRMAATSENSIPDETLIDDARLLDRRMEILEQQQTRHVYILDTTVFGLQLFNHLITVGHFIHIWFLYGVQFTLIDGVLFLHLHSALSSASKKITERRNLYRIARDMDGMFEDATEMELRKAAAAGDVCCICLGTMTIGNVKKVACGHIYHTSCLREVIERARSMEAARCPLCRASIMDGRHRARNVMSNRNNSREPDTTGRNTVSAPSNDTSATEANTVQNRENGVQNSNNTANNNNVPNPGEHALFRFSTEGIFPGWIPLPAFSFEVVRRPSTVQDGNNNDNGTNNTERQSGLRRLLILAGVVPMSPEEEAAALDQLVDMFPQYDRADLLRELRRRGSSEAVAESILMGVFAGVQRGDPNNWQAAAVVGAR